MNTLAIFCLTLIFLVLVVLGVVGLVIVCLFHDRFATLAANLSRRSRQALVPPTVADLREAHRVEHEALDDQRARTDEAARALASRLARRRHPAATGIVITTSAAEETRRVAAILDAESQPVETFAERTDVHEDPDVREMQRAVSDLPAADPAFPAWGDGSDYVVPIHRPDRLAA